MPSAPPVPANATQPRRRTTITTPTGHWALGKTIGAGSMGKVKIAKNMETGEQVSCGTLFLFLFFFFFFLSLSTRVMMLFPIDPGD